MSISQRSSKVRPTGFLSRGGGDRERSKSTGGRGRHSPRARSPSSSSRRSTTGGRGRHSPRASFKTQGLGLGGGSGSGSALYNAMSRRLSSTRVFPRGGPPERRPSFLLTGDAALMESGEYDGVAPAASPKRSGAFKELHGMYVMPVCTFLGMTEFLPFQDLGSKLIKVTPEMVDNNSIIFVSHQWTSFDHPDPDGTQFDALHRLLTRFSPPPGVKYPRIGLDYVSMRFMHIKAGKNRWKKLTGNWGEKLRNMYLWFDYQSIPQPCAEQRKHNKAQEAARRPSFVARREATARGSPDGTRPSSPTLPSLPGQVPEPSLPGQVSEQDDARSPAVDPSLRAISADHRHSFGPAIGGTPTDSTPAEALHESQPIEDSVCKPASEGDRAKEQHEAKMQELARGLAAAVMSIPSYVERSALMLILAPPCKHQDLPGVICGTESWRGRGWCRLEYYAAALSPGSTPFLMCPGGHVTPTLQAPSSTHFLPPGLGSFSCCQRDHVVNGSQIPCDKAQVRTVVDALLASKEQDLLRSVGRKSSEYRFQQCLKGRFLSGLENFGPRVGGPNPDAPSSPSGRAAAVQALMEKLDWSEDEADKEAHKFPLLVYAALSGDVHVVRGLLDQSTTPSVLVNTKTTGYYSKLNISPGLTPLMAAAITGCVELVEVLLDAGADPQARDGLGNHALMWCAFMALRRPDGRSAPLKVFQLWLDRFPEIDLEQPGGQEKMTVAGFLCLNTNDPTSLEFLLEAGSRRNIICMGWHTSVLHVCMFNPGNSGPLCGVLVEEAEEAADARHLLNVRMRPGSLALRALCWCASFSQRKMKFCIPGTRKMLRMYNTTPLHHAAIKGCHSALQQLLAAGADATCKNGMGQTPEEAAKARYGGCLPDALQNMFHRHAAKKKLQ